MRLAGLDLRLADDFRGRAAVVVEGPCRVFVQGLRVDGNRGALRQGQGLPPSHVRFADHYEANGLLVTGAAELIVEDSSFQNVAAFAVLVSGARRVRIARCRVTDSGSLNEKGRNNATGGILLEDGTAEFSVTGCVMERVPGNGLWTHSRYMATRNGPGEIAGNEFREIGRDAIQVGHAWGVDVRGNRMRRVGYPVEAVDVEGLGIPVGIDTAGNVDGTRYRDNVMDEINGKCFDLDGFHHGEVTGNVCTNTGAAGEYPFGHFGLVMNNTNPDMQSVGIRVEANRFTGMRYGGIFVIGAGHVVRGNVMRRLQTSGCGVAPASGACVYVADEPDMLRSGIYLGRRAERDAATRGNRIEANEVSGPGMGRRCVAFAPGVKPGENRVMGNRCSDE